MPPSGGADVKQLLLQVDASVALAQRNLGQLARQVQQDSARMDRSLASVDDATDRLGRGFDGLRNVAGALGVTLGAAGAASAVRGFLAYADAAKTLEAQLRLATAQSGSFAQAQEDVRRIAAETRTGIEETASLYATFQRHARELGISQEQAARATETVSKSFQISGASAAEASGGMRQFLQAVQSGQLRGEEFNSVLENAPRLARLLADSLGVTIGQLRAMAAEGQITGDRLIAALTDRRFTAGIDAEFAELPVTFDQAMTQISNAATIAFGAFDRGGGFSQALANFAIQGAESMASIEDDAEHAGATIRATMEALTDVFGPMVGGAENAFGLIRTMADSLAADMRALFRAWDSAAAGLRSAVVNNPFTPGAAPFLDSWLPAATPVGPGFEARQQQELRARTENSGITGAWRDNIRPRAAPLARGSTSGGGGRGRGGGGGGRARRPEQTASQQRSAFELQSFVSGLNDAPDIIPIPEEELARLIGETLPQIDGLMQRIGESTPDLGSMLSTEDQQRLEAFQESFLGDLTDGLARAIVYGDDLGDALINTIQRAAAELISSGLMDLLTGGGVGSDSSLLGNLARSIFSGGPGGTPIKKFAAGGSPPVGRPSLVGELGPELFVPQVPGVIIPNHMMGRGGGGGGGRDRLDVFLHPSPEFEAKMVSTSAAVVGQMAPSIEQGAAGRAIAVLTRRGLP